MVVSTLLCLVSVWALNSLIFGVVGVSAPSIALAILNISLTFYVDLKYIFPWGVDRFDLVAPWQYRDAEVENS
jgi:hypothetical protein